MRKDIDSVIERVTRKYLVHQMDNYKVASTFTGNTVRVSAGAMSKAEWEDVAKELIYYIQKHLNIHLEIWGFSWTPNKKYCKGFILQHSTARIDAEHDQESRDRILKIMGEQGIYG